MGPKKAAADLTGTLHSAILIISISIKEETGYTQPAARPTPVCKSRKLCHDILSHLTNLVQLQLMQYLVK